MTDLDPEIWKNKTLGAEGSGPFLPEVEKQAAEDRNAKKEDREPVSIEYIHRYPTMPPSGTVPSVTTDFVYPGTNVPVNDSYELYPMGRALHATQRDDKVEVTEEVTDFEDEDYTTENE